MNTKQNLSNVADKVSKGAADVAAKMESKCSSGDMKHRMAEGCEKVKEEGSSLLDKAKEKMAHAKECGAEHAEKIADKAKSFAADALEKGSDIAEKLSDAAKTGASKLKG